MKGMFLLAIALGSLVALSGAASAVSYSLTVRTDSSAYVGNSTISITGQVSPAPGPSTSVYLRVYNSNMTRVTAWVAPVNGTTGLFSYSFIAGGSPAWINGNYVVNATWGAYGPVIFKTATFSWSSSATTTSTTSSTSSSVTSTTSFSTSSIGSTTTSSTTSSSQTSFSSTTSTTSVTTSMTTSATSSGSVPEFPYQIVVVAVFSALVVGSYLMVRSRKGNTPSHTSLR